MNLLFSFTILITTSITCEAFLPSNQQQQQQCIKFNSQSQLYGINEWRDENLQSKYTLDSYSNQVEQSSTVPGIVPILPFPFSDLLLQGQRKQLNLYEQRFHELFQDARENHSGMVGMGLLAGNGMITTLPLCEVESFTRFGTDENWIDKGDGMGNGSIFVTIRAVGRCKIISEDGLLQEEPYMKASVVELVDETIEDSGLKERSSSQVIGESTPLEIGSTVAANIENEMVSIANMEHRLHELEIIRKKKEKEITAKTNEKEDGDEVMNRRLLNAQLESLFMQDSSSEGVNLEDDTANNEAVENEDDKEDEDDLLEDDIDKMDRVSQFGEAFEAARDTDTFGYVVKIINVSSQTETKKKAIRTTKDLTAISWAAFCTGENDNIQREVMKIQALDMTNVLQRLQLAAAMLREEKKKLKAKLSLAGIKGSSGNEDE